MYLLEIVEMGHRIPIGSSSGYAVYDDAVKAAESRIDDALPNNLIRIVKLVAEAKLSGDGSTYVRQIQSI